MNVNYNLLYCSKRTFTFTNGSGSHVKVKTKWKSTSKLQDYSLSFLSIQYQQQRSQDLAHDFESIQRLQLARTQNILWMSFYNFLFELEWSLPPLFLQLLHLKTVQVNEKCILRQSNSRKFSPIKLEKERETPHTPWCTLVSIFHQLLISVSASSYNNQPYLYHKYHCVHNNI